MKNDQLSNENMTLVWTLKVTILDLSLTLGMIDVCHHLKMWEEQACQKV